MTGEKDHMFDRIVAVLCGLSGLPPSEHQQDLNRILRADLLTYRKPSRNIEHGKRIGRAATEIERVLSAMSWLEHGAFGAGFLSSKHTQMPNENYQSDKVISFCRALQDGAKAVIRFAEKAQEDNQEIKNENRRSIEVAIVLSEIYFRITKCEPPKGGRKGPFQRLLHDVYEALGMQVVDLRGPLRKVQEYRKNRHSCS